MAVQKENNRLNGELIDEETILTNSLMGEIHSLEDCLTKRGKNSQIIYEKKTHSTMSLQKRRQNSQKKKNS